MLATFPCFCSPLLTFSKLTFSKNYFRNKFTVSNCLDPDQDRHYVGPDLGPSCLQSKGRVNKHAEAGRFPMTWLM